MLGIHQLGTLEEGEDAMHEVRRGMCCFATEKDWVEKSGVKRGEQKRREKPAKQKSRCYRERAKREIPGGEW